MGLDGVELVLAFEEAFGISIPDAEAEKMDTPHNVIEFIYTKRGPGTRAPCLSRRAFHAVRRRLIDAGHSRKTVRPNAALVDFFPDNQRRQLWQSLRGEFTVAQWPELVRPVWLVQLLTTIITAVSIATAVSVARMSEFGIGILASVGVLIFLRPLAAILTCPSRTKFPMMSTIGDLSRHIVTGGPGGLIGESEKLERNSIAVIVRQITIDQIGINPEDYDENKSFVADFGID